MLRHSLVFRIVSMVTVIVLVVTPLPVVVAASAQSVSLVSAMHSTGESIDATQTDTSGAIDTATTWTTSNSPYVITGPVWVESGVTLTIEPGVEIRAEFGCYIAVSGELVAIGAASSPITFTANTADPAPAYWDGLVLNAGSQAQLDYATVEYGGSGAISAGIAIHSDNVTITHALVRNNWEHGIYLDGGAT